jgi:SAM-dependent methyltransferase
MSKITSSKSVEFYIKSQENAVTSGKKYPNLMLVRSFPFLMKNGAKKVLDYGCGGGLNTVFMLSRGADVCYADTSPHALRMTSNNIFQQNNIKALHNSQIIDKDATVLPFKDEEFDVIVCASVMSLLSDLDTINKLLSEFLRVLKPNGKIYVDINGIESQFVYYSEDIGNNQYKYSGVDKKSNSIIAYCPKSIEEFSNIISTYFNVLYSGFSRHDLFNFKEHEFIVVGQKNND